MKKIIIKTVPDKQQRYNTVGDYYIDEEGNRVFVVSDMNNWKYEFLVVLHELVESSLCRDRNISDAEIDEFDFAFEKQRLTNTDIGEPGDSVDAPYYEEHQFATVIEKMMADKLNVNWNKYSEICAKLDNNNNEE